MASLLRRAVPELRELFFSSVSNVFGRLVCWYLSWLTWIQKQVASASRHETCVLDQWFSEQYGEDYGYPDGPVSVYELSSKEFSRLQGKVYLDHAGATLYGEDQLRSVLSDYSSQLYGNPHSQSESSLRASNIIESARAQVLAFCNASPEEYKCVFTSGATSALKLVGEAFPWTSESQYMYTVENHNSVVGIREYALDTGATVFPVDIDISSSETNCNFEAKENGPFVVTRRSCLQRRAATFQANRCPSDGPVYCLFAFPQECNFSGRRPDLEIIPYIQKGQHTKFVREKWLVLLDAAKGCSTSPPDLQEFPADFVAMSFYKVRKVVKLYFYLPFFGYPTGLGALLIRKGASDVLRKRYFGGGSVAVSVADTDFFRRRANIEDWFEDGTTSFISIAALRHGFNVINRLGLTSIRRHTRCLTEYTASKLADLRHFNGNAVCTLYGNHKCLKEKIKDGQQSRSGQGPIIAFNVRRADGSWVGHREVEKLASLKDIHLRTGCFCNPGACAKYIGLSTNDQIENFEAGHVCWDDNDLINGRPVGAVRVSFGYMSTFEDCQTFLKFISTYFVETYTSKTYRDGKDKRLCTSSEVGMDEDKGSTFVSLRTIMIYPIKSCAGFAADRWPIGDCGLLYDREWQLESLFGAVLTQKKCSLLSSIKTQIDLEEGTLHVMSPAMRETLVIALNSDDDSQALAEVKTRGRDAAAWFSQVLQIPCKLVRRKAKSRFSGSRESTLTCTGMNAKKDGKELSFVNEGQFLLISQSSVEDLNTRLRASTLTSDFGKKGSVKWNNQQLEVDVKRFRPNLVVVGSEAYDEDGWSRLAIGEQQFKVRGGCNRCSMINIDQNTGEKRVHGEPLATLASYRRCKGNISFGVLLELEEGGVSGEKQRLSDQERIVESSYLHVGQRVSVLRTFK